MNPRIFRRWVFVLLPLLVARAFVPAGFMVAGGADGLALQLCPMQSAALIRALDAFHGATQDAHASADTEPHDLRSHDSHDDPSQGGGDLHAGHRAGAQLNACPYALTAFAPAPQLQSGASFFAVPIAVVVDFGIAHFSTLGPVRYDSIRGPPVLIRSFPTNFG